MLGVAAVLVTASGCTVKNPDFCCSSLESCQAAGVAAITGCDDPAAPVCDDDGAYGPARACIADPGTTACSGPADCATPQHPVCDADDTGTCVGCSVGEDCVRFAGAPLCDPDSGECVACRTSADCGGTAPVCGDGHQCRLCLADDECASGVCGPSGACPATTEVVYVDGAAPAGNTACTMAAPCKTFAAGVAQVEPARRYLKVAPGTYSEQVLLDGTSLEVHGDGAELGSTLNPVVDVRNAAAVTVLGLRVRGGAGRGLRCADSTVTLRGAGIENNAGRGVESSGCTLTVERARVVGNVGGGLQLTGGRITIRNSFIAKNGSPAMTLGGLSVTDPLDLALEFNTIADNVVSGAAAAGLSCMTGSPVSVANNIVVGESANQLDSVNCAPTYTLSNEAIPGTGNLTGRPMFKNAGGGDYHLVAGSMGIDQADPAAQLSSDYDREPRPVGPASDLGADELQ